MLWRLLPQIDAGSVRALGSGGGGQHLIAVLELAEAGHLRLEQREAWVPIQILPRAGGGGGISCRYST
jgi:hypothetical protein